MNRSPFVGARETWISDGMLWRTANARPGSCDGMVGHPVARVSGTALRVLVFGLIAAESVLLTACSVGPSLTKEPTPAPTPIIPTPAPPETIRSGVCIDGTGSMGSSVLAQGIEAVAQAVERWVPTGVNYAAGAAPVPALDLVVRKVMDTSSLSMDGQVAHVQIPGVLGTMSKPKVGELGFVELSGAWARQTGAAEQMAGKAAQHAADQAATIRGADWSSGASEIAGCIEALGLVVAGRGERRFILVSDLNQTAPQQVGMARFDGVRLLVIHDCVEASQCIAQSDAWSAALLSRGADAVEFSRPENAIDDVAAWLREGVLQ